MTKESVILTDISGDVGIVTLNRPEVRNALNTQLRTEMQDALAVFDRDPRVLVVVLTGAGSTFCSGRDLRAAQAGEPLYASRDAQLAAFSRTSISKPVIAAVEGHALAGGFELALSCDLLVAAENARLGTPEVKRNLVAVGGALIRLPRRMPYHIAMQLALLGEPMTAAELARWGIVNRLTDPGWALAGAVDMAGAIAANGPSAVRATKEILRHSYDWTAEPIAFDAQMAIAQPALDSPDAAEGIRAFLEKRPPVWTDR